MPPSESLRSGAVALPSIGRATARRTLGVLVVLAAAAGAGSLLVGTGDLSDPRLGPTYLELRGARFGAAFLAGATLAVGGTVVQGLFRNPLADPSILGTTAGASLGGRLALLSLHLLAGGAAAALVAPEMLLPLGSLAGALLALFLLLAVQRAGDDLVVLLLTGFLLSSLFVSLGAFAATLAQDRFELARAMLDFSLGGVGGAGLRRVALAMPLAIAGIAAAMLWARPLDLMLSGEDEARALGVDVREVRRACILWTAVLTAAAVSVGGTVGFVGLIVPHALRRFVGAGHRALVPASALGGGTFLVACDVLTRVLPTRSEIPLGVVTGLIGAPLFLVLLARSRRELVHV
ncbi:MAG: iron ABC transporter permease [bacterium]|nr:iron ABC transporter permease [bacterium]